MITLAIESAISGGSISLFRSGNEIGAWVGSVGTLRAEHLLASIAELLETNNVTPGQIDLVAASAGPGSFTGIRIGIATALGLKNGLGIKMSTESALRAMVYAQPSNESIYAAVPMGRGAVCVQPFRDHCPLEEPRTLSEDELVRFANTERALFVVHDELYGNIGRPGRVINAGANIAQAIGRICSDNVGVVVEPLFISKSF